MVKEMAANKKINGLAELHADRSPHAKLKDVSVLLMEICISWLQGRLNEAACDDWISLGKSEPKGNKKLERKNPRRQISIYFITKCRQPGYMSIEMAALHKKQDTWEWDLALQRASPSLKENTWQLGHGAFTVAYLLWLAVNYRKCMQIIIMEWKERRSRRGLLPDHFRDV